MIFPVEGLYVVVPSDSSPKFPPSKSPPATNTIGLFSFVDSLSVIVTVVATVATSAVPVTLPVILPTNAFAVTVPLEIILPEAVILPVTSSWWLVLILKLALSTVNIVSFPAPSTSPSSTLKLELNFMDGSSAPTV